MGEIPHNFVKRALVPVYSRDGDKDSRYWAVAFGRSVPLEVGDLANHINMLAGRTFSVIMSSGNTPYVTANQVRVNRVAIQMPPGVAAKMQPFPPTPGDMCTIQPVVCGKHGEFTAYVNIAYQPKTLALGEGYDPESDDEEEEEDEGGNGLANGLGADHKPQVGGSLLMSVGDERIESLKAYGVEPYDRDDTVILRSIANTVYSLNVTRAILMKNNANLNKGSSTPLWSTAKSVISRMESDMKMQKLTVDKVLFDSLRLCGEIVDLEVGLHLVGSSVVASQGIILRTFGLTGYL